MSRVNDCALGPMGSRRSQQQFCGGKKRKPQIHANEGGSDLARVPLSLAQLIAALLPLSFLWVFMACVSICERETLASDSPTDFTSANVINDVRHERECDGCPLSYFPKAATTQRVKSSFASDSMSSSASAILSTNSFHSNVLSCRLDRPVFAASPPLILLPPLRI